MSKACRDLKIVLIIVNWEAIELFNQHTNRSSPNADTSPSSYLHAYKAKTSMVKLFDFRAMQIRDLAAGEADSSPYNRCARKR